MEDNITILVAIIGLFSTMIFSYVAYNRGLRSECQDEGKDTGTLMSDIGYIKSGIDDLKRKQETSELRHYALAERVTKVEESSKQAHKRIDNINHIVSEG